MLNKFKNLSKSKLGAVLVFIVALPFVFFGMGSIFQNKDTNNVAKIEQEAYDLAKSKGMKIVTPSKSDIDAFKAASKPVYDDYKKNAGSLGAQLLDAASKL